MVFCAASAILLRWTHRPRPLRDAALLGAAYLSHLLLDLLSKDTSAPYGLELFWPLSGAFVIAPVRLFDDIWRGSLESSLGEHIAILFGLHNWLAVAREVAIVGPFVLAVYFWRFRRPGYSE